MGDGLRKVEFIPDHFQASTSSVDSIPKKTSSISHPGTDTSSRSNSRLWAQRKLRSAAAMLNLFSLHKLPWGSGSDCQEKVVLTAAELESLRSELADIEEREAHLKAKLEHLDEILRSARLSGYLNIRTRWTALPGEPLPIDDADVDDRLPRFVVLHGSCIFFYLLSTDLSPQDSTLLSDVIEVGPLPSFTREDEETQYSFYILTCHGLRYECSSVSKIQVSSWLTALQIDCKLDPQKMALNDSKAAKPLTTTEAIALAEKKMDMELEDIIKMSKSTTTKAKKQRVWNRSQKFLNNAAQEKSAKVRRFTDSRYSIRQGALVLRRSKMQGNQFPLATEAARKAAVVPWNNRPFNRSRAVNINKPRVGALPVQRKAPNGRFARKMAAKPLTSEAIALTEKKMDMALDDIIKMSKSTTTKAKKQRVSNRSPKFLSNAAQEKTAKVRRFLDSRSSLRQGALARRRSNFQGNQFPLATEPARKAAVVPVNNRPFSRSRAVNINKPRVGAPPVQRKLANGRAALKLSPQSKVILKRPQTLDSLFANMKEQRMRVLSQQSNGGRQNGQNGGGWKRQQWGRGRRFGN